MLILGPLLTLGVVAVAFIVGAAAEREMAMTIATVLGLSVAMQLGLGAHDQFSSSISDVVLMAGCILVLCRHRRLWIAAELALAAALVLVQIVHDDVLEPAPGFHILVDALNLGVLIVLLAAAMAAWRKGLRKASRRPV